MENLEKEIEMLKALCSGDRARIERKAITINHKIARIHRLERTLADRDVKFYKEFGRWMTGKPGLSTPKFYPEFVRENP